MISKPRLLILSALLLCFQLLFAQGNSIDPVNDLKAPLNRILFHDKVDKQQKEILRSDGKADNEFRPTNDDEINFKLTSVVGPKGEIDWLQYRIEKDSSIKSQEKIKYLRGLENLLVYFNGHWKRKEVNAVELPVIVKAYEQSMHEDLAGHSIEN